jgi:hypothetical protein
MNPSDRPWTQEEHRAARNTRRPDAPVPFVITEQDQVCYLSTRGESLADVIRGELADMAGQTDCCDRAIWHGNRLVAVVMPTKSGEPDYLRIDDEAAPPIRRGETKP